MQGVSERNAAWLTTLPAKQHKAVMRRLCDMPAKARSLYLRAMRGGDPKAGIAAFCAECRGFESDGSDCDVAECELHGSRPGT